MIINSNLSQAYIKVKEAYQALHYAKKAKSYLKYLKSLLSDEIFTKEYSLMTEKIESRLEQSIEMIGFINAR